MNDLLKRERPWRPSDPEPSADYGFGYAAKQSVTTLAAARPPRCRHCGGAMEWEACGFCGGQGCFIRYGEPDSTCDVCDGNGGWWRCVGDCPHDNGWPT